MAKYRLKAGGYVTGNGLQAREYYHNDRERNIVESDLNLSAMHPEKFERIEEWADGPYGYNPQQSKVAPPAETQHRPGAQAHSPNLREQAPADKDDAKPTKAEEKPARGMPSLKPTTALRNNATGKTLEEQYGPIEGLTVHELKDVAEAESIDLKGATKKEDILKVIKASCK